MEEANNETLLEDKNDRMKVGDSKEGQQSVTGRITGSILVFIGLQITIGVAIGLLSKISPSNATNPSDVNLIMINYIIGPLSVFISWKLLKVINLKTTFVKGKTFIRSNRYSIVGGLIGALTCTMFAGILTEMVGAPDGLEDKFESIMHNVFGIIYICILGPLVEELIFREGIIGFMQRNGRDSKISIGVSAVLFGLIHINPAQVVFATILGIALGMLYWKTRNIWLCGIIHIINNSIVAIENLTLPKEIRDGSFTEMIGSQTLTVVCMIASGVLSWLLLSYFWKTYRDC